MKDFYLITHSEERNLKLVLKALLVGILSSFIVILYRFALSYAEDFAFYIYDFIKNNIFLIPIWFLILISLAFIYALLIGTGIYLI